RTRRWEWPAQRRRVAKRLTRLSERQLDETGRAGGAGRSHAYAGFATRAIPAPAALARRDATCAGEQLGGRNRDLHFQHRVCNAGTADDRRLVQLGPRMDARWQASAVQLSA